ncbi:MAG: 3'-5' exonuclease [Deinococcaceae bacterium]
MEYVVIDLETTGFSPTQDAIVEIGALKICNGSIDETDIFHSLVNPKQPIPYHASKVHGIFDRDVRHAPVIRDILPKLLDFVGTRPVVAHNATFDIRFIQENASRLGLSWTPDCICTLQLSKQHFPEAKSHRLAELAKRLRLDIHPEHRSLADARTTAMAFMELIKKVSTIDV